MSESLEFTSVGHVHIAGVGESFLIEGIAGLDPRTLQGKIVTLDGRAVRVLRVGTVALMHVIGRAFELVVEPLAD
jgi:hypothetical protein